MKGRKMEKEEIYLAEYQQTRQELEEEEDELRRFQRKSEELTAETFSDLQRIVQQFGESNEPLVDAQTEVAQLEADFLEVLAQEKQKLFLKEEEAEQLYRKKIKELIED
jgi:CHASE3 domain sensor protein